MIRANLRRSGGDDEGANLDRLHRFLIFLEKRKIADTQVRILNDR